MSEETIKSIIRYNERATKEIERLKEENTILKQTMSNNSLLINENVLLKSIIKEVREYIEENMKDSQLIFGINDINRLYVKNMNDILEILDKVGDEK